MVATAKILSTKIANGKIKTFKGEERIYYDGYWIRHYLASNTLARKKRLIDQLARRVFHHTESGINTPGRKLEEVRRAAKQGCGRVNKDCGTGRNWSRHQQGQ